jgi:Ca2+-dependent lipid-binding protein
MKLKQVPGSSTNPMGDISVGTPSASDWNNVSLNHSHQPKIEWDDTKGTIKITIEEANFLKTSLSTDDSSPKTTLTLTNTSWFKARSLKLF